MCTQVFVPDFLRARLHLVQRLRHMSHSWPCLQEIEFCQFELVIMLEILLRVSLSKLKDTVYQIKQLELIISGPMPLGVTLSSSRGVQEES